MILITGARGFLGRYCTEEVSKLNSPLFITTSNKRACGKDDNYLFYYLNLEEPESFSILPNNIDTVLHLAAIVPRKNEMMPFSKFIDINAFGVKRLIEAVAEKGCKRFIYASTQMVIEKPFYLPVDETHPLVPLSDYGLSKALGERYCLSYAKFLNVISLRFARIYGAGETPGFVLTNFINRAINGLPLIVYGQGKIHRDLLYVKDAARAILCALNSNASGVFNIGSGNGVSIRKLAETVSNVFSNGLSPVELKYELKDVGEDFYMDVKKTRRELNFIPRYSLNEGLVDYKLELSKYKKN